MFTYIIIIINGVNNDIWINIAVGCGTATIEGRIDGVLRIFKAVEHIEFISVCMTIELTADDVVESLNDASVFSSPDIEAGAGSGWDMSQDVDFFVRSLSSQELVMEPLEMLSEVRGIVQDPVIIYITEVVVHCDDSETRKW